MRVWSVHAVFAAILIGSLAARERIADPRIIYSGVTFERAVLRVARSYGLGLLEYSTSPATHLPALVFDAPGCSQPLLVTLRLGTFEDQEEPITQSAPQQGHVRRYVYVERKWDKPNPWAVVVQRVKYGVLGMFGLTEYVPSGHLLLVDSPPDCQAAEAINWRRAWSREYLTAAMADTEAKTK